MLAPPFSPCSICCANCFWLAPSSHWSSCENYSVDQMKTVSNHNRSSRVGRCVSLMCLVTVPRVVVYGPPSSGQHSVVKGMKFCNRCDIFLSNACTPVHGGFHHVYNDYGFSLLMQSKGVANRIRAVHINPQQLLHAQTGRTLKLEVWPLCTEIDCYWNY